MTLLHLAYLQQLSDLLEEKHLGLAANFGFIAKQIGEKHVVRSRSTDTPKLRHCKACQAPLTCSNLKVKKGRLVMTCQLCRWQSKVPLADKKKEKKETQANADD